MKRILKNRCTSRSSDDEQVPRPCKASRVTSLLWFVGTFMGGIKLNEPNKSSNEFF